MASSHPSFLINDIRQDTSRLFHKDTELLYISHRSKRPPTSRICQQSPRKGWGHLQLSGSECCPSLTHPSADTAGPVRQGCSKTRTLRQKLPTISCNCLGHFISDLPLGTEALLKRAQSVKEADLALMLTKPCDLGQSLQSRCVTFSSHRLKQEFLLCLFWCRK